MTEPTDHELLADYARTGNEAAFARLVARHINLVHSAARRFTGNDPQAEEITQAVFLILARKAGSLRQKIILTGWLYQTARLTAANLLKAETRRQLREQEAYMQAQENDSDAAVWREIAPLLDDAMGRLNATDRTVLLLRYFERQTNAEVAAALGLAEGAVQKRVLRALEKLRQAFAKQGVTHTAQAIAGTVLVNSVQAAPTALVTKVSVLAAKGVATTSLAATVKGTLQKMTWAKIKLAMVVGASVLIVAGVATALHRQQSNESDNTYNAPGVEAFRNYLSKDEPIKLLRFSEIDGRNGVQHHYLAAVDGENFFLREYESGENPEALVTTNNWMHANGRFQGKYYGMFSNECWNINGPYLTKSKVSDPVVNVCQLEMKTARHLIESILNLGVSPYLVKRASFVWNPTNTALFTVGLATNVSVKKTSLGHQIELTNLLGSVIVKNGLVVKLHMMGNTIDYDYATNAFVPIGFPTKITLGKKWFGFNKTFLIEALDYGQIEDSPTVFSPEAKYDSPSAPQIIYFNNGQRKIIQQGYEQTPPMSKK